MISTKPDISLNLGESAHLNGVSRLFNLLPDPYSPQLIQALTPYTNKQNTT
jgi:hypothetical protein